MDRKLVGFATLSILSMLVSIPAYGQSEIDLKIDQLKYEKGDIISISGTIHNTAEEIELSIANQMGNVIWNERVSIENNEFSTLVIAGGDGWEKSGKFSITAVNALGGKTLLFDYTADVKQELVPSWIKDNAKWWADGQITDSDFVGGVEHLISNEIISVKPSQSKQSSDEEIPLWVKNNAKWWADGLISEDDFLSGLEFLVNKGIISLKNDETTYAISSVQEIISVGTSESSYESGEIIVISGQVTEIIGDTPVVLQIFFGTNLIDVAQLSVAQDGTYTHTATTEGPLWENDGEYTVRASYGTGNIAEDSFEFITEQPISETTNNFEVDAGTSGTFDVEYTVLGAIVENMIIDSDQFGLTIIINAENDGSIKLELPRFGIDAQKTNGSDDTFIILIDGREVPYEELSTDSKQRTIRIDFEEGDSDIEIIGTFILN